MECLYNTHSDNIVAYCLNPEHPYGMTVKQMNNKNCRGKQCKHFKKEESHPYWHQLEARKQKRKNRKQRINDYVNNIKSQM